VSLALVGLSTWFEGRFGELMALFKIFNANVLIIRDLDGPLRLLLFLPCHPHRPHCHLQPCHRPDPCLPYHRSPCHLPHTHHLVLFVLSGFRGWLLCLFRRCFSLSRVLLSPLTGRKNLTGFFVPIEFLLGRKGFWDLRWELLPSLLARSKLLDTLCCRGLKPRGKLE
jgi:hypothetical protein